MKNIKEEYEEYLRLKKKFEETSRIYKEIHSGELFKPEEIDLIYEEKLGFWIESDRVRDAYLDDSISDMDLYNAFDIYPFSWSHPAFHEFQSNKPFLSIVSFLDIFGIPGSIRSHHIFFHVSDFVELMSHIKQAHTNHIYQHVHIDSDVKINTFWLLVKEEKE